MDTPLHLLPKFYFAEPHIGLEILTKVFVEMYLLFRRSCKIGVLLYIFSNSCDSASVFLISFIFLLPSICYPLFYPFYSFFATSYISFLASL